MYLSYDQYVAYGGTITDSATFSDYLFEAERLIDWYTFGRLRNETTFPEDVSRCAYKLINLIQMKNELLKSAALGVSSAGQSGNIASQSNDGVSISYNVVGASEAFGLINNNGKGNEAETLVNRYLQNVTDSKGRKVLYRGIYADE